MLYSHLKVTFCLVYLHIYTIYSIYINTGDCLYIGDIGDNGAKNSGGSSGNRANHDIYKIVEPVLSEFTAGSVFNVPTSWVQRLEYKYPPVPTSYCDIEAMFVDWTGLFQCGWCMYTDLLLLN